MKAEFLDAEMNPSENDSQKGRDGLLVGLMNVNFCLAKKIQKLEEEIKHLRSLENDHHHIREAIETLNIRVVNLEMNQPKTKRRKDHDSIKGD